jgi:hypothetical protein
MEKLGRALSGYRSDAKAFRSYVGARLDASGKARQKKREERALALAYRDLGDRASETEQAEERRSFGSVKENQERRAALSAELEVKQGAEKAARQELANRSRIRAEEIGKIDGEHQALVLAHGEAKDDLARHVRRMRELDEDLERPADRRKTGLSEDAINRELAEIRPVREAAQEKEKVAREERDAKAEELKSERQAWKEEEAVLSQALKAAVAEREGAESRIAEAQTALNGSLQDLGKSVVLSGMAGPGLAEPLAKAKEHMRTIEELAEQIRQRTEEAASLKGEAVRFCLVTGGGILVLVLIVVGIVALTG